MKLDRKKTVVRILFYDLMSKLLYFTKTIIFNSFFNT